MAIVDLKVNRDLLDYKFEGYKLSLDAIPVLKQSVPEAIEHFHPSGDEYSYLQLHMSSHFNQLFQDVWFPSCVFFITQKRHLYWNCLKEDGQLSSFRQVWQLPPVNISQQSNCSIMFPSPEWAVVADGHGSMYIMHTPSRAAGEPWMVCHSYSLSNCSSSCYLLHSAYMSLVERHQIDCLLSHFCKQSEGELSGKHLPPFTCVIEWLSFICGQNGQDWSLKRIRKLSGTSALLYIALEASCDALCIASESEFKFIYDSDKPLNANTDETKETPANPPLYSYHQTGEDITIIFRLFEQAKKSDIQVNFEPSMLEVLWRGECVLKGCLANTINVSSSTWIIHEHRLEVNLSKAEVGLMWQELVKGDKRGEEVMDPELVTEIHNRLAHLTHDTEVAPVDNATFNVNELEECDFTSNELSFCRLDGNTHQETHRIIMGGHQCLFSYQHSSESLPVICLRHDVDGLVWQPRNTSSEGDMDNFKIEHIATFSALGYVQASKQDKKFSLCSPCFSFAVVSDYARHVYIYCQPEHLHSALELRNRKTGESVSHIAKQYVVSLEDCNSILGMQVSNECIFVLSQDVLYAIKMCSK